MFIWTRIKNVKIPAKSPAPIWMQLVTGKWIMRTMLLVPNQTIYSCQHLFHYTHPIIYLHMNINWAIIDKSFSLFSSYIKQMYWFPNFKNSTTQFSFNFFFWGERGNFGFDSHIWWNVLVQKFMHISLFTFFFNSRLIFFAYTFELIKKLFHTLTVKSHGNISWKLGFVGHFCIYVERDKWRKEREINLVWWGAGVCGGSARWWLRRRWVAQVAAMSPMMEDRSSSTASGSSSSLVQFITQEALLM